MMPDMQGRFDENDLAESIRVLSRPYVDSEGMTRSRTLCVRLWDGRVVYGSMTGIAEGDWGSGGNALNANITRRMLSIEITESNFNRGGF